MKDFVCAIGVFLLLTGGLSIRAQGRVKTLAEKRVSIQMTDVAFDCALSWLMNEYDIAFGYEESTLDANHNDFAFLLAPVSASAWKNEREAQIKRSVGCVVIFPIEGHRLTLKFNDAMLEDVMNELVRQMGDYRWEINDEVVNIIPVRSRDPVFAELLDLKIGKLEFAAGTDFDVISGALSFKVPEIIEFFKKKDQIPSGESNVSTYTKSSEGFSFSDVTLRDALNKITKIKRGGWSIRRDKFSLPAEQRRRMIKIEL